MTTTIDLTGLVLYSGAHDKLDERCCVMEVAAIAGCAIRDPRPAATWREALARFRDCKTDHPDDASWAVAAVLRRLNDWMTDEERGELLPYALRVVGTRGSRELEVRRAVDAANYAIHEAAPRALESAKRPELAARLRAIPDIVDRASAVVARDETRAVRAAAYAAAAAAADAYAAAYAYAAAADAADAADAAAAAYAYADAADADVRKERIRSSLALVDRMLAVTE